MTVRAVAFDIGGVLEVRTGRDLDRRWERRLGLRPGEFFDRLRRSGLGRDVNLGRVGEAEFARALGRLYELDPPATGELLAELWDWYVGELNVELADYFPRPAEVVFLDDLEANVAAAREAGMQAVRFRTTRQAITDLETCLGR